MHTNARINLFLAAVQGVVLLSGVGIAHLIGYFLFSDPFGGLYLSVWLGVAAGVTIIHPQNYVLNSFVVSAVLTLTIRIVVDIDPLLGHLGHLVTLGIGLGILSLNRPISIGLVWAFLAGEVAYYALVRDLIYPSSTSILGFVFTTVIAGILLTLIQRRRQPLKST